MSTVSVVRNFHPSPPATAVTTRVDGLTVVWLWGEVDVSAADVLSGALAAAFAAHDDDVVVDLQGVTFIDGSSIRILARGMEFLQLRGRRLTVRRVQRAVRRAMRLADMFPATAIEDST